MGDDRADMSPLELMEAYHAAWERGDHEAGWTFYSEDAVFHMGGHGPLSGEFRGREAFVRDWVQRVENYVDEWHVFGHGLEYRYIFDGPEGVAMLLQEGWRKGDRSIVTSRLGLYRVVGGEIVECFFSDMNQALVEDFFGDLSEGSPN